MKNYLKTLSKKGKPIVSHYGNVGVDSGQLLIIDPCYLEMFMKKYSLDDIFEHPAGNMVYPKGHEGIACKLESFGGDGYFPVYSMEKFEEYSPPNSKFIIDID